MSKKKKTGFPLDLWRVDYYDTWSWRGGLDDCDDESYKGEELPREEAERQYAELTKGGTQSTEHPHDGAGYYKLVRTR